MQQSYPMTRDLVLVGGGHSHALVLRMWGMDPLPGVRVTLINPGPTAPYSGMLPGFVAGHYGRDDLDIDLIRLARFAGARVILGAATGIDLAARTVKVPGRPPIGFDVASVDIGITSDMPDLPGFAAHGVPAKPLGAFAARWDSYRATTTAPRVAVVGGGVAGAELIMAMSHALRARGLTPELHLIDRGPVLPIFNRKARQIALAALAGCGVTLIENATVTRIEADHVVLADGRMIPADFVTGAAGSVPAPWLAEIGLETHDGFLSVGPTLQSSDSAIFAVGDCAHLSHAPRPKAGVFAVRQAPILLENLRAALSGGPLRPYHPQKDYLKLVSLGDRVAMAEKLGTAAKGRILWGWKDRIDRKFMQKFQTYPVMVPPALPAIVAAGLRDAIGDQPMCGGCGAKVGRGALGDVLGAMPATVRDDVHSVPGDDAAIVTVGGIRQIMTTDHLRSFTADWGLMTRIAAIHALGDIWAMGGRPQAVTVSLILPRLTADLQRRTLTEVMTIARDVIEAAGGVIVGGHTSVGDEYTVGFTVTGQADRPITLSGAQPGDRLILTKPIGSGVIMAAEMRGLAKGADVAAALARMCQPQDRAAALLNGAHAMTDVTGFGLAGHLAGICAASGMGAELDQQAIPVMAGAERLAAAGVRSSIYADNRSGAGPVFGANGAKGDLLFDPQTAGGLLAVVAETDAAHVLQNLMDTGHDAAIIGQIVAGAPVIRAR